MLLQTLITKYVQRNAMCNKIQKADPWAHGV